MVTTPPLSSLTAADLTGDLALTWPAAGDEMELAIFPGNFDTSWSATALCRTADDGAFTIPRGLFDAFVADTDIVRIDLRRVREATTETSASGFYLGSAIPARAEAVLRLIRLETWTITL